MNLIKRLGLVGLSALSMATFALAADGGIEPGDPAPGLAVKTWYKGAPVTRFAADRTYVVEFWATWCGPCIESIPHLTELAKKNPDVDFIGVSIWEDDKGDTIPKFIHDMGDKMDYHVGYSGNQDGMAKTWMEAAGQNGIPTAFIIKGGKIQWVGHPMSLEGPLQQVKAGTFDLAKFKPDFDKRVAENRKRMALNATITAIEKQYESGQRSDAKKALDQVERDHPDAKDSIVRIRFRWLAKEDPAAWEAQAAKLAASSSPQDVNEILTFVLFQTQPDGNLAQGHKALNLVLKSAHGKDLMTLQYAQAFYTDTKEYQAALDTVNQILEVLPTSNLKDNVEFRTQIEKSKKELEDDLQKQSHK